jgi:hypothetical protein
VRASGSPGSPPSTGAGLGQVPAFLVGGANLSVDVLDEVVPVTVERHAAKLQEGFGALGNPAHAAVVEAKPHDMFGA